MTKKKAKDAEEPRFEVKKRQHKEKPNFFQNIPSFQHPLAEILNFPAESRNNETSNTANDAQNKYKSDNSGHSKTDLSGTQGNTPLDTPISSDQNTQNEDFLDTQNTTNSNTQYLRVTDTQTTKRSDTQSQNILTPNTTNFGQPESEFSGAGTPKSEINTPRRKEPKGVQTLNSEKIVHSKNENWRKYDKARSTTRVNLHIDKEIDKKVRKYCFVDAEPKVELREFYERAAVHLLNFLDTQNLGSLSAETPLDDRRLKMMFKTKPFIINLYLRYNTVFNELSGVGKKWTARWSPRDDESATRYNDLPTAIVELGIVQTQIQKGFGSSRIQTFKYYMDEIESVLSSGISDEMLETILQYHRQIWKKQTGREIELDFMSSDA